MKQNTIVITVVIVLVIAAIVAAVWFSSSSLPNISQSSPTKTPPKEKAEVVSKETVVAGLPTGFPIEAGASSTSTYKYTSADQTNQQSVISYISKKTLADNMKIFKDFFADNGYMLMNKIETKDLAVYLATKGKSQINVSITTQSGSLHVTVSYK